MHERENELNLEDYFSIIAVRIVLQKGQSHWFWLFPLLSTFFLLKLSLSKVDFVLERGSVKYTCL